MSDRNTDWYARHQRGESYAEIARSSGTTRNAVSGAVDRHRSQLGATDGRRKTDGPTRAQLRAVEPPKMPRSPRRQAADLDSLERFRKAADEGGCLWIDGDLRSPSAVCCGAKRSQKHYCDHHHARAYAGTRKPVDCPPL
jgi:hypothetical protein